MSACVYPGSFDPFTLGHLDITERAGRLFDRVIVLICTNSSKKARFLNADASCDAVKEVLLQTFSNPDKYVVDVLEDNKTVVDYMAVHDDLFADGMNRGIRDASDADMEIRLFEQYKWFANGCAGKIEFIPLIAKPEHKALSSTLVREMTRMSTVNPTAWPVPDIVRNAILAKTR